jgi:hypothetical protein
MPDGLWTAWTTRKRTRVAHPAHSPDDEVALFSMIKWPCFRLSRCNKMARMALFSVIKWPCFQLTETVYP